MQRLANFWRSSVDLHVCALGGPTNVETILHLSPSVLQHHWCNSLTCCSYSVMQFGHILHLRLVHQVWIGRRGLIAWPLRSPYLTPLDFFLWGYIKDLVYQTKVRDVAKLRDRITAACETVTPVMLQNTWREVEYRFDICRATKGAHVEIY
jgi:hypothetical protein